ncbi:MAG: OmpA family protein [Myxococcota bacterium]|nr:OmpA family protein [Myxococcota bacterium]
MSAGHERWVISYADMVTLLFALFTALYAMGIKDKSKASLLAASIQEALNRPLSQKVLYQPPSVVVPTHETRGPASQSFINSKDQCVGGPGGGSGTRDAAAAKQFLKMKEDLEKLQDDPELSGKLTVDQLSEREVLVRLTSAGFFDPGSNEPNEGAFRTLEQLAVRLRVYEAIETRVEGHTDNIPISGGRYPSNWELSSARASAVVRALVERSKMDPTRMTAVGYGEFRPVAENDTIEGRKANRRIDILIRQPPSAQEKAWMKGQSTGSRTTGDGSGSPDGSLGAKDGKRSLKPAGNDPLDPNQFIESFGLHSKVDEKSRAPTRSPPTRRAPSPSSLGDKSAGGADDEAAAGGH